jgi:hypothetical protein
VLLFSGISKLFRTKNVILRFILGRAVSAATSIEIIDTASLLNRFRMARKWTYGADEVGRYASAPAALHAILSKTVERYVDSIFLFSAPYE